MRLKKIKATIGLRAFLTICFLLAGIIRLYAQEEIMEGAEIEVSDDSFDPMAGICASQYEGTTPPANPRAGKSFLDKIANLHEVVATWCEDHNVADRMDVGLSLGDMGLGLELSVPVTKWANVRAGIDWLPQITVPLYFSLSTYSDGLPTGNFNRVQELLYEMTGIEIDDQVKMKGKASMVNFKLLVDVFPFQDNRHWHFTAGFYAGTSQVAKAINDKNEMPTLVGLNVYNRAYNYFTNLESIFDVPLGGGGYMDPDIVEQLQEKFRHYGRIGIRIGDFKNGESYIMEPAPDGSVSAKAFVNHFKPYLGAGYSTDLDSKHRWHFGVDFGVLFWGGDPKVINHDYVSGKDINFTKDLVNIRGKVGEYMKVVHALPIYPMLSVKVSYTIW